MANSPSSSFCATAAVPVSTHPRSVCSLRLIAASTTYFTHTNTPSRRKDFQEARHNLPRKRRHNLHRRLPLLPRSNRPLAPPRRRNMEGKHRDRHSPRPVRPVGSRRVERPARHIALCAMERVQTGHRRGDLESADGEWESVADGGCVCCGSVGESLLEPC